MPIDPSFAPTTSVISGSRLKTALAVLLIAGAGSALAAGAVLNGRDAVKASFTEKGGGQNGAYELPAGEGIYSLGQIALDRKGNRGKADVVLQNIAFNVRNMSFYGGEEGLKQQNIKFCLAKSNSDTPIPAISDCITVMEGDGAPVFIPQMRNDRQLRGRYSLELNFIKELVIPARENRSYSLIAFVEPASEGIETFRYKLDKKNTDIAARIDGRGGYLYGKAKIKGGAQVQGTIELKPAEQGEGALTVDLMKEDGPTNIIAGGQGQYLAGFRFKVTGEPITINKFDLRAHINGKALGWTEFTNIELTDQLGNILAGPMNATSTASEGELVRFTDEISLPVGVSEITVRGNVSQQTSAGDTIQLYVIPPIDIIATGDVSSKNISPRPQYEVESYTRTIKTPALEVSVLNQPFAQNVIAGSKQFALANYKLDATNSAEDIQVSNLPLEYNFSENPSSLRECSLYSGDYALASGSRRVNPGGDTKTGDDFEFLVEKGFILVKKGTSEVLTLKCDVSTSAKEGSTFSWGIDGSNDLYVYKGAIGAESGSTLTTARFIDSNGQTMTVSEQGSYTVRDSFSPRILLMADANGSSGGHMLGAFRFEAAGEDVEVKQISLELAATEANSPSDLVGQRVTLWNRNIQIGVAQFGGVHPDHATSTLSAPLVVRAGSFEQVEVRGDLTPHTSDSPIGAFGSIIAVKYDGDNNGLQGNYGTGIFSDRIIEGTSPDTDGSFGARVFRSVPAIQDVTTATTLAAGANLYQVEIHANGGRDIGLHKLSFGVRENGASVTGFQLFGPTTGAVNNVPVNAVKDNGEMIVEIIFDDANVDRVIPGGTTKTYSLRANTITGLTAAGTETLAVQLLADKELHSTPNLPSRMLTVADFSGESSNADNFIWTPFSTTTPSSGSQINSRFDWTNGYGALGFPSLGKDMPARVFKH